MERKYVIPLRKECMKVPIYLKTRKAVKAVRNFIAKHMKCEDVRIGPYLNHRLWERGNRHPPHKVEVLAEKIEEEKSKKKRSYVKVELFNAPKEEKKKMEKRSLIARLKGEKKEEKKEVIKEEKHAPEISGEKKEAEKEELKAEEKKEEIKEEEKLLEKEEAKLETEKLQQPEAKFRGESKKSIQKNREAMVKHRSGKLIRTKTGR